MVRSARPSGASVTAVGALTFDVGALFALCFCFFSLLLLRVNARSSFREHEHVDHVTERRGIHRRYRAAAKGTSDSVAGLL